MVTEEKNENLNLIQKLAKVRSISDVAQKNKKGFNYTYTDITEILAKVTAGMNKYGVSLIPQIVPGTSAICQNVIETIKVDKTGKPVTNRTTEMLFSADMVFKWVNDSDPTEFLDVPWHVTGAQGDPSQAFGSALTYCTRYFLTNYFQIAQPDTDVDAYRSKQKEAEASEDKAIAKEIIGNFDTTLRAYLADHEDKKQDVIKFISRFVKDGNYKKITEPTLAAKLAADFENKFIKGE